MNISNLKIDRLHKFVARSGITEKYVWKWSKFVESRELTRMEPLVATLIRAVCTVLANDPSSV